jgi:hypothetical protein
MGRPTKTPKAGERVSLGLRVTADIKKKLDKAAERASRSQSQEAERRLERSFAEEDRLGGPQLVELLEAMASAMKITGQTAALAESDNVMNQGQWLRLPYAFDQAAQAAAAVLEQHRPPGERDVPQLIIDESSLSGDLKKRLEVILPILENLGERVALLQLRDREEEK